MKKLVICTATVIASLVSLVFNTSAQSERGKTNAEIEAFGSVIRTILTGSDLTPAKGMIHPEAYIIHGKIYESIFNLMSEASRRQLFGSVQENEIKFFHATINDGKTTAFVVVKTEGADSSAPRFHTIIFVKSVQKGWQLLHWHAGSKS